MKNKQIDFKLTKKDNILSKALQFTRLRATLAIMLSLFFIFSRNTSQLGNYFFGSIDAFLESLELANLPSWVWLSLVFILGVVISYIMISLVALLKSLYWNSQSGEKKIKGENIRLGIFNSFKPSFQKVISSIIIGILSNLLPFFFLIVPLYYLLDKLSNLLPDSEFVLRIIIFSVGFLITYAVYSIWNYISVNYKTNKAVIHSLLISIIIICLDIYYLSLNHSKSSLLQEHLFFYTFSFIVFFFLFYYLELIGLAIVKKAAKSGYNSDRVTTIFYLIEAIVVFVTYYLYIIVTAIGFYGFF